MTKQSLSVIFITCNEGFHIGDAIANVADIAEAIYVVDSGSTDQTVAIAERCGAKVLHHPFEGFGAQWNWALENCRITTTWTMKMDPDERLTNALKDEIRQSLEANDPAVSGYSFDRVLWFMGCRLPSIRGQEERIWRSGKCRFTDVKINEHPLIEGRVIKLRATMDHLDSQNLECWITKQNRYSTMEAQRIVSGSGFAVRPNLFGDRLARRMWFKRIFFHIPFRYQLMFVQYYVGRGLWRYGRVGVEYVRARIWVRRTIENKVWEMCSMRKEKYDELA